ncbi:glycosyltransferase [Sphingomonas xinjiangensis]|uniref:Glycosyltransferase involved in cell wall biosynthesis n=1 Tax=Sphingomonas xinjiangensis TaxID=643568 RepID=A0A840YSV3_9SPHN|nr:glycosyltransferase [Sphingomonas xinjiangensis]MBB5712776.1 glycosyltransferase involved in cell wall biosynthesis [Sphingomonas xinjiangensis]
MKISIWSYANLERVYGVAFSLARFLRAQGHDVRVLYVGEVDKRFVDEDGIEVRSIRSPARSGLKRALVFWWGVLRARDRSDAILMVGTRSALFSWPFWSLRRGRTIVFAYELDGDGRMEAVANRLLRAVDHVVEVNGHRARLRAVIARRPDAVIRNVPDRKTAGQISALHGVPRAPNPHRIMYGGLIAHYQGLDLLVRGFAQSEARELELIGNHEEAAYLDMLRAIPLPPDKRLTITGPMPRPVLLQRLWAEAAALVCLYPYRDIAGRMNRLNTKYAEPTKYYEYILLGIPFVTFRHPSLPQGEDGIFTVSQSEDAIADGLNRALACSRTREGRPFARGGGFPVYEAELASILPLLKRPSTSP